MSDAPQPDPGPFDILTEQALIGALLLDSARVPDAVANVAPEEFFDPMHSRIFAQIVEYAETDRAITPLTLNAAMKADPGLMEVGGTAYLAGLAAATPTMPPVKEYARILRDLSLRRDAMAAMEDAKDAIQHSPKGVDHALRSVMVVAEQADRLAAAGNFQTAYDAAYDSMREAERMANGAEVIAVPTGLAQLDKEIGGFRGSDLIVIPGRSGMGKSAVMGGLSLRASLAGYPTIVFSLEMKRRQWVERLVADLDFDNACGDGPLWYSKFRNGRFTAEEFARIGEAMQRLDGLPLDIHDEDGLTMAQIGARAKAFKAKHKGKLGLVVIDYLQIVDPASRQYRPREQEVAGIARAAKALAKNLDWPVIAGSQMNEADNARAKEEKRPQGSDVRESKAIFHEADLMIAPYRPAYYIENKKPDGAPGDSDWLKWKADLKLVRHKFELLGLKNRHGRRFDLDLFCDMAASAIRDYSPRVSKAEDDAAQDMLRDLVPTR